MTETDQLARALEDAAPRWAGEPRSRLVARHDVLGHRSIRRDEAFRAEEHRDRVSETRGRYGAAFPLDYLEEFHRD